MGLQPNTYRLYPTAFRFLVPERNRPLSTKATHAVATLAFMAADLDVLDCQAHTGEREYFDNLPTDSRRLFRGSADDREWSSHVSWSPFHYHFRKWDRLPAYHWRWLDQLALFVVSRPTPATEWEAELVDLPTPNPAEKPASEPALRAMLDVYSLGPAATDVVDHLHQWFLPSAARVLRWDLESTWARRLAEPYYPGTEVDWCKKTILAVEPKWVRPWTSYV
jgi:hypothetical protein